MRLGVLDVAASLPLGAGRLTREWFGTDQPSRHDIGVTEPATYPSTLREGVILRRLDTLDGTALTDRSAQDPPNGLGRSTSYEARWTG